MNRQKVIHLNLENMTKEEAEKIERAYITHGMLLERPLNDFNYVVRVLDRMLNPNKYKVLSDSERWGMSKRAELEIAGILDKEEIEQAYSSLKKIMSSINEYRVNKHPKYKEAKRISNERSVPFEE